MILINDKLYVDLNHLATDAVLNDLDREISFGLSKAEEIFLSVGYEYSRGDAALDLYDHSFKDVKFAMQELSEYEKSEVSKMTLREQQKYLKIAKGAYFPWAVCYSLLNDPHWNTKMEATNKHPTEEARRLFPNLIEWCFALPVFKSIGRICIFGIDPCQHVTCHRDLAPDKWDLDDEFIMISPRANKKFYLYDPAKKIKHYVPSKIFMFHDLNYHGVDASPFFNYSIRIDGLFTDTFKQNINFRRPQ